MIIYLYIWSMCSMSFSFYFYILSCFCLNCFLSLIRVWCRRPGPTISYCKTLQNLPSPKRSKNMVPTVLMIKSSWKTWLLDLTENMFFCCWMGSLYVFWLIFSTPKKRGWWWGTAERDRPTHTQRTMTGHNLRENVGDPKVLVPRDKYFWIDFPIYHQNQLC